jgi:hypothetical protein
VLRRDYLLYRAGDDRAVYDRWRERCGDMSMLVGRKA